MELIPPKPVEPCVFGDQWFMLETIFMGDRLHTFRHSILLQFQKLQAEKSGILFCCWQCSNRIWLQVNFKHFLTICTLPYGNWTFHWVSLQSCKTLKRCCRQCCRIRFAEKCLSQTVVTSTIFAQTQIPDYACTCPCGYRTSHKVS